MDSGEGYCRRCRGMVSGLVGLLILINAMVWPLWSGIDGWMAFFGLLLVIGSVFKAFMPGCGCHGYPAPGNTFKEAPAKEAKKKK
jgi:hypothetical protein